MTDCFRKNLLPGQWNVIKFDNVRQSPLNFFDGVFYLVVGEG